MAKNIRTNQYNTKPIGPVKYVKINEIIKKNFGIAYFSESLAIQAPINKLIAKKWSQKIKRKDSLENIV